MLTVVGTLLRTRSGFAANVSKGGSGVFGAACGTEWPYTPSKCTIQCRETYLIKVSDASAFSAFRFSANTSQRCYRMLPQVHLVLLELLRYR